MSDAAPPWAALEPDGPALRRMVEAALDRLVPYLESLPTQPASLTEGSLALARSLEEPLPEEGTSLASALDTVFRAAAHGYNAAGPGYLAYIPGGGIVHAAVGGFLAACINRYVGIWPAAPGLIQLERNVLDWFSEIVGYPAGSGGFLTTGGSLANLSAVITARHERLPEDFLRGTLYTSDQAHHSIRKAARLAGFPERNVREVPSDAAYRVDLGTLREAIARDRRAGFTPFCLVGHAGTTNTGAVDDLRGLAAVAREAGLWFHVDAAYGGFFRLTDHGRRQLAGLEAADSITLDPHKALFLPYGTGALLVRDPAALARAHRVNADYLPEPEEHPVDFCHLSPELSRELRGLRVWLPFRLVGAGAFRSALEEKLALIQVVQARLRAMAGVEILAPPQLTVLAFRLRRPGLSPEETDALNRRLLERINARRRVFLSGTLLRGVFAIRVAVLALRTHAERIEMALEDVAAAIAEVTT